MRVLSTHGVVRWFGLCAALGLAGAVVASACSSNRPPPAAPLPVPMVCAVAAPPSVAGAVPTLRADAWARLLIRGYTPGMAQGNVRDCTDQPVAWREPTIRCRESAEASSPVPQRPLTEDDVVVQRLSPSLRLVWIIVDRFDNGEAVGPVALAEFTGDRVGVRAIGTLRTFPRRPRLRLEAIGARRVLIGEGEVCTDENNPLTCRRQARLMMLQGDRFVAEPLRTASGRCLGPARFEFKKEYSVVVPETGWERTFELQTSLQYRAEGVQVSEQVTVSDHDRARPQVPARIFRRAAADRAIYVINNAFVASDPSLWNRVLRVDARTGLVRDGGLGDASNDAPDADDEADMDLIGSGL
jgi:hypothetical protein